MSDETDEDGPPATLEEAAKIEQRELWSELPDAIASGIHTDWSMRCDNLAWRITNLARLVGATPWEEISVRLLRSGVYERVLNKAGIPYGPIDWDRVTQTEERIASGIFYGRKAS